MELNINLVNIYTGIHARHDSNFRILLCQIIQHRLIVLACTSVAVEYNNVSIAAYRNEGIVFNSNHLMCT